MPLFSVTHTQLSIYLDKIGFIVYLVMPVWPLIKFRDRSFGIRISTISLYLWIFLFVNEWVVYQLSRYSGVRFFTGLGLYFGLFVSLAYTVFLSGILSVFHINSKYTVVYRVIDIVYCIPVTVYFLFLVIFLPIHLFYK